MATRTQVLYGNRLYGRVTYELNDDPQTFTATLSDSQASADADTITIGRNFADTQSSSDLLVKLVAKLLTETETMSDARVMLVQKILTETQGSSDAFTARIGQALAETQPMTEARTFAVAKAFSESVTMTPTFTIQFIVSLVDGMTIIDNSVVIVQTKGFTDFVLLKEWVSIKLSRPNPWTAAQHVELSLTLYAQPLYAQKLFGATPTTAWAFPNSRQRAWTNSDGQNINEA